MDRELIKQKNQEHIESLKAMLQAYVDRGNSIDDLSITDPEYTALKNFDIRLNKKRLTLDEKLKYLGHPRKPQQSAHDRVKAMLQAYVDKGGVLEDLKNTDPEYIAVKNYDVYIEDKRLSMEEKFSYLGFQRKPQQKPYAEKLKEIAEMLDEFVAGGGNVDEINQSHPIYARMRAFTPVVNGKKLSMEEKFELAGHPRYSRYNNVDVFIERLAELENYKDENGCVDDYRKNPQLKLFVSYCAQQFEIPISLVVCMLADQKLNKHLVQTNRVEFLKTRLGQYVETYGDFHGIRRLDPSTYYLLNSVAKTYPSESGRKFSSLEIVELLGFEDIPNRFAKSIDNAPFDEVEFITKYAPIIEKNNGVISLSNLTSFDYNQLTLHLRRINSTKKEFFAKFGVTYKNPVVIERDNRILAPEYPYLEEMKAKLNEQINDLAQNMPEITESSDVDLFSLKAYLIKNIYDEYKTRIEERYILGSQETESQEERSLSK